MPRPDLLVLVKHARPDVDPALPSSEWTLGVDGLQASVRLAAELRPLGLDLIVGSVEPKAAETARIVARELDVAFQTGQDLHEQERRSAGYLDASRFHAAMKQLFATPDELVFGDETGTAAGSRFGAAVDALGRVHRGKRLCVVAHGTVIALHLEREYGADGWATWQSLDVPSYVVVDRRDKAIVDVVSSV